VNPLSDGWYRFGRLLSRIFIPAFGSIEVVGREHVPPEGPLIIAPNHQSNADPPVLVYAVPRPLYFMAKRSLFAGPVASYFLRAVHVYPVDRDGRDVDALRWALGLLASGRPLVLFPEGTRSPGALQEATEGLAYIALRSGAPVLPVAITGTEQVPGMFRIAFHFKRLRVVIGEPLTLPRVEGPIERAALRSATDQVMGRIAALLPPSHRGFYADPAEDARPQPSTGGSPGAVDG